MRVRGSDRNRESGDERSEGAAPDAFFVSWCEPAAEFESCQPFAQGVELRRGV